MGYKVFISHSVRDIRDVERLAEILEEYDIEAYIAERDRQYGKELSQKIKRNIENSDAILVLWTKNSKHSDWVNQEIGYAEKCERLIIPLIERGVKLRGFIGGREYVSFDIFNIEEAMEDVAEYLKERKIEKEQREKLQLIIGIGLGLIGLGGLAYWLSKRKGGK